jgi:hypothetical protein
LTIPAFVGVIAQLHLDLDDIDPCGIGKPLFGGPAQPAPFEGLDHATFNSDRNRPFSHARE